MKAKKGFTLVEILIVVVILGILAAIVIPQFTEASTEAKQASLRSDLQTVRSQIELYKIQHNDVLPGQGTGGGSWVECMTGSTDVTGDPTGTDYGPYIQQLPMNPFNNLSTVRVDGANPGEGTDGWQFNSTTGAFHADDAAHATW